MKKFELTLVTRQGDKFEVKSVNKVESDDIVGLLAQFHFVLVSVMRELHSDEMLELRLQNDDIPF